MAPDPTCANASPACVALPDGDWINALTNERHTADVPFGKLRGGFPVVVLERDGDPVG